MTLQELKYLVAIATHRHFGRAADACKVTQPTLSAQVRKLEAYLGVVLIDRSGKQPVPTPLGELIVERARRLMSEADEILRLTRLRRGPLQGALNIGLIPTLAPYFLPWLLPQLGSRYPRLHPVIHEDTTQRLEQKLDENLIDVAFLALPMQTPGKFAEYALFDEPFFVACPIGHAIANEPAVHQSLLAKLRLMLLTDGHCLRGQALAACGQVESAQDSTVDCRATSLETLRQLVVAGMGCTLLPALAVHHGGDAGLVMRPLASGESRRIGGVWLAGHARGEELRLLCAGLQADLPAGVHPV